MYVVHTYTRIHTTYIVRVFVCLRVYISCEIGSILRHTRYTRTVTCVTEVK